MLEFSVAVFAAVRLHGHRNGALDWGPVQKHRRLDEAACRSPAPPPARPSAVLVASTADSTSRPTIAEEAA
jgi:hypothetical protein